MPQGIAVFRVAAELLVEHCEFVDGILKSKGEKGPSNRSLFILR